MFPKKPYKKRKPTLAKRGQFSKEDIEIIKERDNGYCYLCNGQAQEIHHCRYKSQGGRGVYTNGISLCRGCHVLAHSVNEIRVKLENQMIDWYGSDFHKDKYDN